MSYQSGSSKVQTTNSLTQEELARDQNLSSAHELTEHINESIKTLSDYRAHLIPVAYFDEVQLKKILMQKNKIPSLALCKLEQDPEWVLIFPLKNQTDRWQIKTKTKTYSYDTKELLEKITFMNSDKNSQKAHIIVFKASRSKL